MSDSEGLRYDSDGFVDMDAFTDVDPDAVLSPAELDAFHQTLADSPVPVPDDAAWDDVMSDVFAVGDDADGLADLIPGDATGPFDVDAVDDAGSDPVDDDGFDIGDADDDDAATVGLPDPGDSGFDADDADDAAVAGAGSEDGFVAGDDLAPAYGYDTFDDVPPIDTGDDLIDDGGGFEDLADPSDAWNQGHDHGGDH